MHRRRIPQGKWGGGGQILLSVTANTARGPGRTGGGEKGHYDDQGS